MRYPLPPIFAKGVGFLYNRIMPTDLERIIGDLERKVETARRIAEELPSLEQRLAVARELHAEYNGGPSPRKEEAAAKVDWPSLSRRKAILLVLQQSPEPMSPAAIGEELRRHGRKGDESHSISAALANMKKAGKVVATGFAQWTTADREPPGDPRKGDLLGIPRPAEGGR